MLIPTADKRKVKSVMSSCLSDKTNALMLLQLLASIMCTMDFLHPNGLCGYSKELVNKQDILNFT